VATKRVKRAVLSPDTVLQPHQRAITERLRNRPDRLLLMHALGSGKTLSALAAAEQFGEPYAVAAPASVRPSIKAEQAKFTTGDVPSKLLSYSELARGAPLTERSLILDEVHRLRNLTSKATQQVLKASPQARQMLLLSGTPIVNAPADLATPLSLLTGKTVTPREFTERYVGQQRVGPGFLGWLRGVPTTYEPTIQRREELKELLKGKVDYYAPGQPTVPVQHKNIEVEMSPDQTKLYRSMWERLPWLTRWKLQRNYPMTEEELRRTRAFLSGPRQVGISPYPFMGRKDPLKAFQVSTKLQKAYGMLLDKLQQDPRHKALVFSNFIDAGLIPYSAGLTQANIPHAIFHGGLSDSAKKQIIEDFNQDKLRTLLLGPSGTEGLNFKGVQLVQMLDPHWHSARGRQAAARGLRFGSHEHLPEELRNVEVQRFTSKLPLPWTARLAESFGLDRGHMRRTTDDYLKEMSKRKEGLNREFINLLKEIGTEKASALGIPSRTEYGDLGRLQPGKLVDWIVQQHLAERAGLHSDVRFGTPDTGLYSWAVRKGLPAPGVKHLAIQQPIHEHGYKEFEGTIPSGQYGGGQVKRQDLGRVLITKINPEEVHFTTAHPRYPERYMLKQTKDKKWLLINTTKTEPIPHDKIRYTTVPAEKVESILQDLKPGTSVQAKIDGAASLTRLYRDHAEVVSYRVSKETGRPIVHTERVFGGRPELKIPPELVGTVLRGELYGVGPEGKTIPPQALGGLLNAAIAKSLEQQKAKSTQLKQMVFDIQQLGQQPVDMQTPYDVRRRMVESVLAHLPPAKFHPPEEAKTPAEALALWQRIGWGVHPLTQEGIVIHPPTGKPSKAKYLQEHDVHIREFFPGKGKYEGTGIGGFRYSHTPTGPVVGEVGTGFSDELRKDMFQNPQTYLGRVAKVRAQEKHPSGALRAPALLGVHEDYPAAPSVLG